MKTSRHQKKQQEDFWLRLDNAAKIYPAIQNNELTAVFRISVVLKQVIKIKSLLEALQLLEHRFPYYQVKAKKGFFWYYLEYYNSSFTLIPDTDLPCRAFDKDSILFRILVRQNRISVEFSHILTDGTGGFEFLKSLLLTYFKACGIAIPDTVPFHRPQELPSEKEFEDTYTVYFQKDLPPPKKMPNAFHLPFTLKTVPRFDVITAIIPLDEISSKAKQYSVSITVYLASAYLHALQEIYNGLSFLGKRRRHKILRVEVPINLRKMYPSKTMRNFSFFVLPEIDLRLGHYSFEEILKTVYHLMQLETDKKLINKVISRNVGAERNLFIKNTPLFIKSLILSFKYQSVGTNLYSGVITNLGKVSFPPNINELIDYFAFIPPPPNKGLKVNCGVIGFENKLVLSFANITTSKELERRFFTFLTKQGIAVKIIKY